MDLATMARHATSTLRAAVAGLLGRFAHHRRNLRRAHPRAQSLSQSLGQPSPWPPVGHPSPSPNKALSSQADSLDSDGELAGVRVLVSDTKLTHRAVLQAMLTPTGAAATCVASHIQAQDAFAAMPFDAVLLDCSADLAAAEQTLATLRQIERDRATATPIIAMISCAKRPLRSGVLPVQNPSEIKRMGFSSCLERPISQAALVKTLVHHCHLTYLDEDGSPLEAIALSR